MTKIIFYFLYFMQIYVYLNQKYPLSIKASFLKNA